MNESAKLGVLTDEELVRVRAKIGQMRRSETSDSERRKFVEQNTRCIALAVIEVYEATSEDFRRKLSDANVNFDRSVISVQFANVITGVLEKKTVFDDDLNMVGRILEACLIIRGVVWWDRVSMEPDNR